MSLKQNSKLTALASELESDLGYLPEEAVKEAALNSSSALGSMDLSGECEEEDPTHPKSEADAPADVPKPSTDLIQNHSAWVEGLQASVHCLVDQMQAVQEQSCGTRDVAGVSVVELQPVDGQGPRIVLVDWTIPAKLGRIFDMDSEDNLVPVVCVGSKRHPTDFQSLGANIIIPATGVTYTRDKRAGKFAVRNKLPAKWKRVMDIWRAVHSGLFDSSDVAFGSLVETCDLCSLLGPDQIEGKAEPADANAGHDRDASSLCPLCLLQAHKRCCQKLCEFADNPTVFGVHPKQLEAAPECPSGFHLPDAILSNLRTEPFDICNFVLVELSYKFTLCDKYDKLFRLLQLLPAELTSQSISHSVKF